MFSKIRTYDLPLYILTFLLVFCSVFLFIFGFYHYLDHQESIEQDKIKIYELPYQVNCYVYNKKDISCLQVNKQLSN